MPNHFGAINHFGNPFQPRRFSIAPHGECIQTYATLMSMKRGSKRESLRSLPSTIIVNNRPLPVRWVA